jgi:hypothetical protein
MTAQLSPSQFRELAGRIEGEVARVIVGQQEVVRHALVALLADGHLLLEGLRDWEKPCWCARWPLCCNSNSRACSSHLT